MRVSVKIDYACRVLAQMAQTSSDCALLRIQDLADRESLSSSYLDQILNDLKQGGLIMSRRGKEGGYTLARSPDAITLYDVIKVVEGEVMEFSAPPSGESGDMIREVWTEIRDSLVEKYHSYTLASMIANEAEPMYYI